LLLLSFQIYKKLRILFLGTGTSQGVPVITCECAVCRSEDSHDKRLRTSVLIGVNNQNIVIDTGPDFRQQMLTNHVTHLEAVLLTHGHKDHLGGLDDIRAFNYFQKRAMDIYGSREVLDIVEKDFSYAFGEERYPGVPDMNLHPITNQLFQIGTLDILPVEVVHYKMEVFGYRINDFVYITDASFIDEVELKKLRNVKILVLNALRKAKHYSHFNLEEALAIIDQVKPEAAYLTHISHQMGLHHQVQSELPENVFLAYDGLILEC
jgi:phosphoribosyl 1,2-cyclic phosphate phosphodiesterase